MLVAQRAEAEQRDGAVAAAEDHAIDQLALWVVRLAVNRPVRACKLLSVSSLSL